MEHFIPSLLKFHWFSKRRPIFLVLVALSATTGIMGAHSWFHPVAGSSSGASHAAAEPRTYLTSNPALQATQPLELERITITPRGFEPGEITRSGGHFLLAVDNRSGLDDVSLRLERVAGARVHEQRVSRSTGSWRGVVNLAPGSNQLAEAHQLAWVW